MPGAPAAQGYAVASRDTASAVFLDGRRRVRVLAISEPFAGSAPLGRPAARSTSAAELPVSGWPAATSGCQPVGCAATGSTSDATLEASAWPGVTPACGPFGCAARRSMSAVLVPRRVAAASGCEPFEAD